MKKAVFLDRDGTLIKEKFFIKNPDQVELEKHTIKALRLLKEKGFLFVVISNQSGISRGILSMKDVERVNQRIQKLLGEENLEILDFMICPHLPEHNCSCRKPSPGMILKAAEKYTIDLSCSYMIGDKCIDVEAGKKAGVAASILVLTGYGRREISRCKADFYARDLLDAALWINIRS